MTHDPVRLTGGRIPRMLSREDELAAWYAGDHDALIESAWQLVVNMATKIAKPSDAVFDELLSEAGLRLTIALKTYDPSHGTRFVSYARQFMRLNMLHACRRFRRYSRQDAAGVIDSAAASDDGAAQHEVVEADLAPMLDGCTDDEIHAVLGVVRGLTFDEIGQEIGKKRQTVHYRYLRAIEKCRQREGVAA